MPKRSAALLLYRRPDGVGLEVLIAHMGGPFWAKKNARAWSIPKGEYEADEDPRDAAFREFEEEMGSVPPAGPVVELGETRQANGKIITTYAMRGDFEASNIRGNTFKMEWPRGSGNLQDFPEIDRAEWMSIDRASQMLVNGQVPILEALTDYLQANVLLSRLNQIRARAVTCSERRRYRRPVRQAGEEYYDVT
jgi:predicted NUDIX family NTP pyrophosphohydrolase